MTCLNPIFKREERVHVPCGRCLPCLKKKRVEWSFRLERELEIAYGASFITLTYSDENLTWGEKWPTLVKSDLQKFFKDCRYRNEVEHQLDFKTTIKEAREQIPQLRYYAVGEYGSQTFRPHYHIILFNLNSRVLHSLNTVWKHGNIQIDPVTPASIAYTTKYVITSDNWNSLNIQKPFAIMSRRPPIGENYLSENGDWHKKNKVFTTRMLNGNKVAIPRYYKDKIFDKYTKKRYTKRTQIQMDRAEKKYIEHLERMGFDTPAKQEKYILERNEMLLKKQSKNITKNEHF